MEVFKLIEADFINKYIDYLNEGSFKDINSLFDERLHFYNSEDSLTYDDLATMWFHKQNEPNLVIKSAFVIKGAEQDMME